jgi:hypothetical protein
MSVPRAAVVAPLALERGWEGMGIEMYILAFLVIATGYLMTIRGNKK